MRHKSPILLMFCVLASPGLALACGGLFCSTGPGAAPVDQTAERILFEVEEDRICTTVEIAYTGAPEAFAWVVPVPELPEVSEGDAALLNALAAATDLKWVFPPADNGGCPYPDPYNGGFSDGGSGCGCAQDEPASEQGDSGGGGAVDEVPPPQVQVFGRQQTENYETVTIGAEDAGELVRWLDENDFNVSENMVPVMQPYADEGLPFLAIKLRAGRTASQIAPLRFCYRAAAPMIPLRLTAVAAQPQMSIQVFIVGYTLFSPIGAEAAPPDTEALAFDAWGNVSLTAWLARQTAHREGRFWALEYAGETPEVTVQDLPDGKACEFSDGACSADEACTWVDQNATDFRCVRRCEAGCRAGEDCLFTGFCAPTPRTVQLGPWLTRYSTRMGPELMTDDPVFVATPELPAFDGTVDLSERGHVIQCYEPILERLPSPCAYTWCGFGARCVHDSSAFPFAACACAPGQVAVPVPQPDGLSFQPTCVDEENPFGVLPEDGGDPCATYECGDGTCVARGGFPTCRCNENTFAFATFGEVRCEPIAGEIASYAEGAGPETGNRDDARITTPDPRAPGLPAMAFALLVVGGLLRRRRSG